MSGKDGRHNDNKPATVTVFHRIKTKEGLIDQQQDYSTMLLNLNQLIALLGIVAVVQAGNPYANKSKGRAVAITREGRQAPEQLERQNGPRVVQPKKKKQAAQQASNPNVRNPKEESRKSKKPVERQIYANRDIFKGKKPKANYPEEKAAAVEDEKAAAQFLPPGFNLPPQGQGNPGYPWQSRTITVTVTRGYERVTNTVTVQTTNINTEFSTASITRRTTEVIYVNEHAYSTVTSTDYVTVFETVQVGDFTTIETGVEETIQPTETATNTVTEEAVISFGHVETVWETNIHTEIEFTPVTSTSIITFSDSTVITPYTTVTQPIDSYVTVTETVPVEVTSTSTVQDVATTTEVEIVYETPALMNVYFQFESRQKAKNY